MKIIKKLFFTRKARSRATNVGRISLNVLVILISLAVIAAACYYNVAVIAILSDLATNNHISLVKLTNNDMIYGGISAFLIIIFAVLNKIFNKYSIFMILMLVTIFIVFIFVMGAAINMVL